MLRKALAAVVARNYDLEFLSDVIPQTITFKEYKEKKSRKAAAYPQLRSGQTTLDGTVPTYHESDYSPEEEETGDPIVNRAQSDEDDQPKGIALDMAIRGTAPTAALDMREKKSNGEAEPSMDVTMQSGSP